MYWMEDLPRHLVSLLKSASQRKLDAMAKLQSLLDIDALSCRMHEGYDLEIQPLPELLQCTPTWTDQENVEDCSDDGNDLVDLF